MTNTFLNRLADIGGDWHEFESKAHRRQNERIEKEARKAAATAIAVATKKALDSNHAGANDNLSQEKKKRPPPTAAEAGDNRETGDATQRETKRQHIEAGEKPKVGENKGAERTEVATKPNLTTMP